MQSLEPRTQTIHPDKITKPIQLLATWLVGLVMLCVVFVVASSKTYTVMWVPKMYAITAVVIIPLFLIMIFILQTKFRPELQEDMYYARYLRMKEMDRGVSYSRIKTEEN